MLDSFLRYFQEHSGPQLGRDALDILLAYYVFYRALLVLRGTRAMQVGVGLAMVFLLYLVAKWLQLATVLSVLGALISSAILIIVVVFQSDIRRGLQRVGSRALLGAMARAQESKVIDEVVDAATELARHRIGAIIAFEQDANLDEFVGVHKGHDLDAAVSQELLVSLFVPEGVNKLHDGAVIIRNLRIAKAGVFFPMPEGKVMDESFGSRHRAALGITEETDAVVVVVSEERGTISFCFNGNIAANLDGPKLRTMLEAIFSPKLRPKKKRVKRADLVEPVSVPEAPSERTRPPPIVRLVEIEPGERPAAGVGGEGGGRDSEPPPPPLRPRPAGSEAEPSAKPPKAQATPLRAPPAGRPTERAATGLAPDSGHRATEDDAEPPSPRKEPPDGGGGAS